MFSNFQLPWFWGNTNKNIKCGVPPVKHDLSVVLGYIRSFLKPAPKTPHASLASSGMSKALWHCFHFLRPLRLKWLLTPQLFKCDVEKGWKRLGNHTGINRKSSWVQKEIVSEGQEQPKSLQSRWQFQMSHIEVCPSSGFCSFTGTHTLSLAEMLRLACGHSCSSSKVTTAFISFSL